MIKLRRAKSLPSHRIEMTIQMAMTETDRIDYLKKEFSVSSDYCQPTTGAKIYTFQCARASVLL